MACSNVSSRVCLGTPVARRVAIRRDKTAESFLGFNQSLEGQ